MKNTIQYEGQQLIVETIRFSEDPDDSDGSLTLELLGSSVRIAVHGNEMCHPYIRIQGLKFNKILKSFEYSWFTLDDDWINKTYFSLTGEGFSIFGTLKLAFIADDMVNIHFDGETDFPVSDDDGEMRYCSQIEFNVDGLFIIEQRSYS
jgi:hypothetical protein